LLAAACHRRQSSSLRPGDCFAIRAGRYLWSGAWRQPLSPANLGPVIERPESRCKGSATCRLHPAVRATDSPDPASPLGTRLTPCLRFCCWHWTGATVFFRSSLWPHKACAGAGLRRFLGRLEPAAWVIGAHCISILTFPAFGVSGFRWLPRRTVAGKWEIGKPDGDRFRVRSLWDWSSPGAFYIILAGEYSLIALARIAPALALAVIVRASRFLLPAQADPRTLQ